MEELPHWLVYLENNSGSSAEHGWTGRSTELQQAGASRPGEGREQRGGDPLACDICRESQRRCSCLCLGGVGQGGIQGSPVGTG